MDIHNTTKLIDKVRFDLAYQKERILFDQFNSLIKDGVLQVTETEPVLIQDADTKEIKLQQAVRLTFHAEEILENYRKKVARLSEKLAAIERIMNDEDESE